MGRRFDELSEEFPTYFGAQGAQDDVHTLYPLAKQKSENNGTKGDPFNEEFAKKSPKNNDIG